MIMLKKATFLLFVVLSSFLLSQSVLAQDNDLTHEDGSCNYKKALPDSSCTPGAADNNVTSENVNETICISGYSKTVRPGTNVTTPIKENVMKWYGNTVAQADDDLEADCSKRTSNKSIVKAGRAGKCFDLSNCVSHSNNFKCYELDHLISLELGGCPDCPANLWPEPYYPKPGAHEKDRVENYLHKQVCNGDMTLEDAQMIISADWTSCYENIQKHKSCE